MMKGVAGFIAIRLEDRGIEGHGCITSAVFVGSITRRNMLA
jgi:hypothetical protein